MDPINEPSPDLEMGLPSTRNSNAAEGSDVPMQSEVGSESKAVDPAPEEEPFKVFPLKDMGGSPAAFLPIDEIPGEEYIL